MRALNDLALKRNPSLVSLIYEKLENMILSGQLQSGDPINERALSMQFEVSRAPIREACRRLEQAGLVSIIDNRGAFVREVSKTTATEIYDVARMLSAQAARRAVSNATAKDITGLEALAARIESDAARGDLASYYAHNDLFHLHLVMLGRNEKLTELYRSLNNELTLYRQRGLRNFPDLDRSLAAHRAILAALASRDDAAYRDALDAHSNNMTDRLLNVGM